MSVEKSSGSVSFSESSFGGSFFASSSSGSSSVPSNSDPCYVCHPDITTLYCAWYPAYDEFSPPYYSTGPFYFEATGTLNGRIGEECWGQFIGGWWDEYLGEDMDLNVEWQNGVSTEWDVSWLAASSAGTAASSDRCDPSATITYDEGILIISTTPLP